MRAPKLSVGEMGILGERCAAIGNAVAASVADEAAQSPAVPSAPVVVREVSLSRNGRRDKYGLARLEAGSAGRQS